jgi:hypothetical protein
MTHMSNKIKPPRAPTRVVRSDKEWLEFYLTQLREFNHNDAADFFEQYIRELGYTMESMIWTFQE